MALLDRLFNAFEDERWEEYPDILADDIVAHEKGEEMRGLNEQLAFEKDIKQSKPDAAVTVEEMATSGNTVFSRGIAPDGGHAPPLRSRERWEDNRILGSNRVIMPVSVTT